MKRVYIELEFEDKHKKEDITEGDVYNCLYELMIYNILSYWVEEDSEED